MTGPSTELRTGSDRDLVARAQAGSLEAFDRLVAIHQARVYALARRILGDDEDAADVQQDTFVRAWRSLRKFRQDSEFATWLHRITVNLCLSRKRRKEPISNGPLDECGGFGDRESPTETGILDRMEREHVVREARRVMAAMPVHYRVLLVLRDVEGRPFEEIAQILGCSEASARVRATRARQLLRERMKPYLAAS